MLVRLRHDALHRAEQRSARQRRSVHGLERTLEEGRWHRNDASLSALCHVRQVVAHGRARHRIALLLWSVWPYVVMCAMVSLFRTHRRPVQPFDEATTSAVPQLPQSSRVAPSPLI